MKIFEVLCNNKNIPESELLVYDEAVEQFREGNIVKAYEHFQSLESGSSSKLYNFYIERCEHFINNPELEFTPILKMTTK